MKFYGDLWLETMDNLELASDIIEPAKFNQMCMQYGLTAAKPGEFRIYDDLHKIRMFIWHNQVDRVLQSDPKKYGDLLKERLGVMPEPDKKTNIYH